MGIHLSENDEKKLRKLLGLADGEPFFVLRGQDKLATPTLSRYRVFADTIESPEQRRAEDWFASLDSKIEEFQSWQAEHPDVVKLPD